MSIRPQARRYLDQISSQWDNALERLRTLVEENGSSEDHCDSLMGIYAPNKVTLATLGEFYTVTTLTL